MLYYSFIRVSPSYLHITYRRIQRYYINTVIAPMLCTQLLENYVRRNSSQKEFHSQRNVIRLGSGISTKIKSMESRREMRRLSRPSVQWALVSEIYALKLFLWGLR
jgi:hypothetical protein